MDHGSSFDLNSTWLYIQPELELILEMNDSQSVSSSIYMNCYTAVYNYCVKKTKSNISNNYKNYSYSLTGEDFYAKLEDYLTNYVRNLKQNPNETFLNFYVDKWVKFINGARYMNNVFDYMNRHWVKKKRLDGRRDIFDVNTLAILKWKEEMFDKNCDLLILEILNQITKLRDNEIVNTYYILTSIKSLVRLGFDSNDLKNLNLNVYLSCFEKIFLEKTVEYYRKESSEFLSNNLVIDYMKKCERRLIEEINKSNSFLEDHTKKYLLEALNKTLIEDHTQKMYDQFLIMLEKNDIKNIQKLYKLLSCVPNSLEKLGVFFEDYIKEKAIKLIELLNKFSTIIDNSNKVNEKKSNLTNIVNPKIYVNTLVSIYKQFKEIVIIAFNKNCVFIKSLENACCHFINNNPIVNCNSEKSVKTSEILAKYADFYLKNSNKNIDKNDLNPDNLMIVFRFLEDKDDFEEFYRHLLAKRLINRSSKSDKLEEVIIQRFQKENSIEYTKKMTKMLYDIKISEEIKQNFNNLLSNIMIKEFNPLILAKNIWPLKYLPDYELIVSPELKSAFDKIIELYNQKHNERRLKWLWNHGKAEVNAYLSKKNKDPFVFTVSNIQLMILMAFNKKNTYTHKELHEIVGTSKHSFDSHLLPFIKYKLLEKITIPFDNCNNYTLKITSDFKSKKLKVNFIGAIKNTEL